MCAIAARLSRRPLKYTAATAGAFWNLRTVQQIRAFIFPDFRTFIRTIFLCLDPIARSISLSNLRLVLRRMPRFLFHTLTIQSEVFGVGRAKPILLSSLREWCRWWETKCSRLIVIQVRVHTRASHGIISYFNNSSALARTPEGRHS